MLAIFSYFCWSRLAFFKINFFIRLRYVLIFTGECSVYPNRTACLSAFPGRECVWHNNGCLSLDVASFKQGIGIVSEFERSHNCTPDKGRLFLLTLYLLVAKRGCLLMSFANSLDPHQSQHNIGPDLNVSCLSFWCYS